MAPIKCFFIEKTGVLQDVVSKCRCGCGIDILENLIEYVRTDTGEKKMLKWLWQMDGFPLGGMYFNDVFMQTESGDYKGDGNWNNDDGHHLKVSTPGGIWDLDTRASNCTMPEDRLHRCWVRHGTLPNITVDKQGFTCSAGAGSIMFSDWHGKLIDGYLVEC